MAQGDLGRAEGRLGSSERLRLGCATRDDKDGWRPYLLDVTLADRTCDALEVALDIVHRAAAFKLRWCDGIGEEPNKLLGKMAGSPPLQPPERGKLSGYRFPYYEAVKKATAIPAKYQQQTAQP